MSPIDLFAFDDATGDPYRERYQTRVWLSSEISLLGCSVNAQGQSRR